ncbi:HAD family hydrolase [Microbacterium karelineae]|uniref:HAD family hydrolase n=1 Tax=Microbacterium karelineae TaxID=2654283 RepID=UPI0012EA9CB9|nr:HAD family hydrolase [Microbacterium karelineae]
MASSLGIVRDLIRTHSVVAIVSDLDGVLRVFDDALWVELDVSLGLVSGASLGAVLGNPLLRDVVRGRASFAEWRSAAVSSLVDAGADPSAAEHAVERWAETPGRVDEAVRSFLVDARDLGLEVFVLTNGTDRIRSEVTDLGVKNVLGEGLERLLSSHEIGFAKPEREAYEIAHARIVQLVGTIVDPRRVVFLDDTARNVEAARAFGWRAVLHRSARA